MKDGDGTVAIWALGSQEEHLLLGRASPWRSPRPALQSPSRPPRMPLRLHWGQISRCHASLTAAKEQLLASSSCSSFNQPSSQRCSC